MPPAPLGWYSVFNVFGILHVGQQRCSDIGSGPIVWLDSCPGTFCPDRPNARLDISSGEETGFGVTHYCMFKPTPIS